MSVPSCLVSSVSWTEENILNDSAAPERSIVCRQWLFIQLYRWVPSILEVLTIIQPETLVRWHTAGFRCYWRWKSRRRGGRPQLETGLRGLIRRMSMENPVCTENSIRVADVMESPKLPE
jgi:hypothetical protein